MENMLFTICDSCKGYLMPGTEKIVRLDGETVVLCETCLREKGNAEAVVFERKYNL